MTPQKLQKQLNFIKNGHNSDHMGTPMARIWHVPYYHIVKHLFKPKGICLY